MENEIMNKLFDGSEFFKMNNEIKDTLEKITCKNILCKGKKIKAAAMLDLFADQQTMRIKVNEKCCCNKFKKELEDTVNAIINKWDEK
jgi:hypothetical protein